MYLENIVFDAVDPRLVGQYWEAVLGTEPLTDEPGGYETRLELPDGPVLDLCFQQVAGPVTGPERLHLGLTGDAGLGSPVLRAEGAAHEMADPAGNTFTVEAAPGPLRLSTLDLEVADPGAAVEFWAWISGWEPVPGRQALRHPSGLGPVLAMVPQTGPGTVGKNRIHLDVRLEPADDLTAILAALVERGGQELHPGWGELPWRTCADPSGNEFCLLPARSSPDVAPADLAEVLAPLTGGPA